ncbi:PREDICTED: uncharacterized protein LOC108660656 [Theobroma cacao]|uniref:Uncharacterized protein LOC108660656 n=1 Tax=Theobroma cacao TaxID=3641 RepID=A0AB32VSZ1_THECC|nr:PREDICTED: uncharacterized protein LOC108660656 [Theobroma cacao]
MEEMNHKWGLQCLYDKAWQAKEYAESLVFRPSEESFQLLPSYFHMFECENLGTITCVTTNGEQRFKYCFWAFGSCIRDFSAIMRLVVAIDTIHLKGRFKGILFVVVCKDANEQIYPVAFGIGHVEDKESWSWFFNQLRRAIGCPKNAMFIFDQDLGIKNAVEKLYKDAYHGLCNYHLGKNVKNRFKRKDVTVIFTLATKCYRLADFNKHMNKLTQLCKPTYDSLMRLGLERWAHARSPVRQYKLMTSNIAECINSCLRHARKMPITVLIECIKGMFQR